MRTHTIATLALMASACVSSKIQPESPAVQTPVQTAVRTYEVDGSELTGFLAKPASDGVKRPAVLVVHEWWGHNDYARRRATELAELGYVAFALDMYGDGKVADHPEDATAFMNEVMSNRPMMEARFQAGMDILLAEPEADAERTAAIGYCMGGAIVLDMARKGADLDAVVSFHGLLQSDVVAKRGSIKGEVLVLTGADDPMADAASVAAFEAEMEAADQAYALVSYVGAVHAFTNPAATALGAKFNMPLRYDAEADADSWRRMVALFAAEFGTE